MKQEGQAQQVTRPPRQRDAGCQGGLGQRRPELQLSRSNIAPRAPAGPGCAEALWTLPGPGQPLAIAKTQRTLGILPSRPPARQRSTSLVAMWRSVNAAELGQLASLAAFAAATRRTPRALRGHFPPSAVGRLSHRGALCTTRCRSGDWQLLGGGLHLLRHESLRAKRWPMLASQDGGNEAVFMRSSGGPWQVKSVRCLPGRPPRRRCRRILALTASASRPCLPKRGTGLAVKPFSQTPLPHGALPPLLLPRRRVGSEGLKRRGDDPYAAGSGAAAPPYSRAPF